MAKIAMVQELYILISEALVAYEADKTGDKNARGELVNNMTHLSLP
jgi:hypothetical protein